MPPKTTAAGRLFWIVVADVSAAVIYSRETKYGPLTAMSSLDNSDARKHTGELITDRGGRAFDSMGAGRHTMTKEKGAPKRHSAEVFSKEIAERVAKALHDGSCRGYALIAAPRFLGMLRDALAVATSEEPYLTIDKDVVTKDAETIRKLLAGD